MISASSTYDLGVISRSFRHGENTEAYVGRQRGLDCIGSASACGVEKQRTERRLTLIRLNATVEVVRWRETPIKEYKLS